MSDPMENANPHKFTSVKEGWDHYVWGMSPNEKEYHAHERAFYAGSLCAVNMLLNALHNLGPEESFVILNSINAENQAFAERQIKIHTPNPNN